MNYTFSAQFEKSRAEEHVVAEWLVSNGKTVEKATRDDERAGIDFWVDGHSVEVKNDFIAHTTDNAAIEVVQVSTNGDPGWLWSCRAEWLVYRVVETGESLWLKPDELRKEALNSWKGRVKSGDLRAVHTQNEGYVTTNWLVPLAEIRGLAHASCTIHGNGVVIDTTTQTR